MKRDKIISENIHEHGYDYDYDLYSNFYLQCLMADPTHVSWVCFLNCRFYFRTSHPNAFREIIYIYQLSRADYIVENEGVV